jgi:hypothetical protein
MPASLHKAVLLGCLKALPEQSEPEQSDTSTTFLSKADECLTVFHCTFGAKLPVCTCLQERQLPVRSEGMSVGVFASAARPVRHQGRFPKQTLCMSDGGSLFNWRQAASMYLFAGGTCQLHFTKQYCWGVCKRCRNSETPAPRSKAKLMSA